MEERQKEEEKKEEEEDSALIAPKRYPPKQQLASFSPEGVRRPGARVAPSRGWSTGSGVDFLRAQVGCVRTALGNRQPP